jgi:hypothetical protein
VTTVRLFPPSTLCSYTTLHIEVLPYPRKGRWRMLGSNSVDILPSHRAAITSHSLCIRFVSVDYENQRIIISTVKLQNFAPKQDVVDNLRTKTAADPRLYRPCSPSASWLSRIDLVEINSSGHRHLKQSSPILLCFFVGWLWCISGRNTCPYVSGKWPKKRQPGRMICTFLFPLTAWPVQQTRALWQVQYECFYPIFRQCWTSEIVMRRTPEWAGPFQHVVLL